MRREFVIEPFTRRIRFAHYLTLLYCVVGALLGLGLRDGVLFATTEFRNNEVGIVARYPAGWLLDTTSAVLRATDTARPGFKTVIEIDVLPFAPRMSARNVIDGLTLARQGTLPYYRNLTTFETTLGSQDTAVVNEYSFVFASNDPFLQSTPATVIGRDVLVIRRNQAILITFQTDKLTYEEDLAIFDRFLESLDY